MEPPPASLEAMVRSRRPSDAGQPRRNRLLWLALLLVAIAMTAYVLR